MTVAGPADAPEVISRRRINLLAPDVPWEAYHAAARMGGGARGEALIERAVATAREMATEAVRDLIEELRAAGHQTVACGVVLSTRTEPVTLEQALASHTARHAGEGQLYREALIHAAGEHGLRVVAVSERDLEGAASAALGVPAHGVRQRIGELGRELGPPWAQDQKQAALVAWLALVNRPRPQRRRAR